MRDFLLARFFIHQDSVRDKYSDDVYFRYYYLYNMCDIDYLFNIIMVSIGPSFSNIFS